jgi:hypothetical protein
MRPRHERRSRVSNFVMSIKFLPGSRTRAVSSEAALDKTWPVLDLLQAVPEDLERNWYKL